MIDYRLNLYNLDRLTEILNQILKWNANQDLIFFNYDGEYHERHCLAIHRIGCLIENPNVEFELCFYHSTEEFKNKYAKNFSNDRPHNILMVVNYIEKGLQLEYVDIKEECLSKYDLLPDGRDDKKVLVFSYHQKLLTDYRLIVEISTLSFEFDFDVIEMEQYEPKEDNIIKLFT